ncbi:MAG: hypothetical protein QG602_578 [Verrucomicrobiota bacterium]|nr:hypothetical protein [Verrucomicrobiota bacterium]
MPTVVAGNRIFTTRVGAVRPSAARNRVGTGPAPDLPTAGTGFATAGAILQRYDQGRSGLEEAVLELFHGGISPAHAEIAARRLFGPTAGLAELAARAHDLRRGITAWLDRPLARGQTCVFLQAVTITRKSAPGQPETEVQAAVGVDPHGGIEVLGIASSSSGNWDGLLGGLRRRGLPGVELFVGDSGPGVWSAARTHFPHARYQVCLARLEELMLYKVPAAQVHVVVDAFVALRGAASAGEARAVIAALRPKLHESFAAAALLDEAGDHLFTHLAWPAAQQAHLRDASFLKKPLGHLRTRVRLLGPGLDDEALVLLLAARLRQTWPAETHRRFKALVRPEV